MNFSFEKNPQRPIMSQLVAALVCLLGLRHELDLFLAAVVARHEFVLILLAMVVW